MQTNTESNTNTTRITLASLVRNCLVDKQGQDVTVKEVLKEVESRASGLNLSVKINYRSVYQQLRSQAHQTKRGTFTLQSEEAAVAA
jgi:hypothetical protein